MQRNLTKFLCALALLLASTAPAPAAIQQKPVAQQRKVNAKVQERAVVRTPVVDKKAKPAAKAPVKAVGKVKKKVATTVTCPEPKTCPHCPLTNLDVVFKDCEDTLVVAGKAVVSNTEDQLSVCVDMTGTDFKLTRLSVYAEVFGTECEILKNKPANPCPEDFHTITTEVPKTILCQSITLDEIGCIPEVCPEGGIPFVLVIQVELIGNCDEGNCDIHQAYATDCKDRDPPQCWLGTTDVGPCFGYCVKYYFCCDGTNGCGEKCDEECCPCEEPPVECICPPGTHKQELCVADCVEVECCGQRSPGFWGSPNGQDEWPAPFTPDEEFPDVTAVTTCPGVTNLELITENAQGGNAFFILSQQLMGAVLNSAEGQFTCETVPAEVTAAIAEGQAILNANCAGIFEGNPDRERALELKDFLEAFNHPVGCDD